MSLYCRIFGHKFIGTKQWLEGDKSITQRMPVDFCINCGLSKKDLLPPSKILST